MLHPTGVLAPVLGFVVFLVLLPARHEHLDIEYVDRPAAVPLAPGADGS